MLNYFEYKLNRVLITGGAGFIGSKLACRLAKNENIKVVIYDNFSTGKLEFVADIVKRSNVELVNGDLLDAKSLLTAMQGVDFVFHLAANADVRFGLNHPEKDLQQNTIATFNVLEAMRQNGVKKIAFASTGSVYGEAEIIPTPENAPFPIQTSLYGASKLAGEGLIAAYCEGFSMQAWVFRFVSILGEHYSHGHIFDFYRKLIDNPDELMILGNGQQKKSYLYVGDCIKAMLTAIDKSQNKFNLFNLGTDEYCTVNDSARWICEFLRLNPRFNYSGGERGWIGDNPFIWLDCGKIRQHGWKPQWSIRDAVLRTVQYLQKNEWLFTNNDV